MINRTSGITFSIFGFLIAISGIYLESENHIQNWLIYLKYVGIIFLIFGALISFFSSKPFSLKFVGSDWKKDNDGFYILVPYKRHKKRSPISKIMKLSESGYQTVGTSIQNENDNVKFLINSNPFEGKLIIK